MEISLSEAQTLAQIVKTDYLPSLQKAIDETTFEDTKPLLQERYNEVSNLIDKVFQEEEWDSF